MIETAISSGVSALIFNPIGVCTRSKSSLSIPFFSSWSFTIATRRLLPIIPIYAFCFSTIISRHSASYLWPRVTMTNHVSESPPIFASPSLKGAQMTLSAPAFLTWSANFGRSSRTVTSNPSIFPSFVAAAETCPPPQITRRGILPIRSRKILLLPSHPLFSLFSFFFSSGLSFCSSSWAKIPERIRFFPASLPHKTVSVQTSPSERSSTFFNSS